MPEIYVPAVLAATAAAFVIGSTYYAVLVSDAREGGEAAAQPAPWQIGIEVLRCLTLAVVVAGVASHGGVDDWTGGVVLGLALWIGFPLVLWAGAMLWESTPFRQAALHGGDWLIKLIVVALIVSVWN